MIIAERKPFAEIKAMLAPYKKILIVGCGTCVAACPSGSIKQNLFEDEQIFSEIEGVLTND